MNSKVFSTEVQEENDQVQMNGNTVVSEEEWVDSIRSIIQRDYFPLTDVSTTESEPKRVRLDAYLANHISEDHAAFAEIQKRDQARHAVLFKNSKEHLRIVDFQPNSSYLLANGGDGDSTKESKPRKVSHLGKSLEPSRTRFSAPEKNVPTRRLMLKPEDRPRGKDYELLSMTSRSTSARSQQSSSGAPKTLSARGMALVEKIRQAQKRASQG